MSDTTEPLDPAKLPRVCPECGSYNLLVGARALACANCEWGRRIAASPKLPKPPKRQRKE